jgi:hypothetical protein
MPILAAPKGDQITSVTATDEIAGIREMKMNKLMVTFTTVFFVASAGAAFAKWEPVADENPEVIVQYTAVTAGKSGKVKECYAEEGTLTTYTWTHSQTGKTRGTYTEFESSGDSTLVDNSLCGG